MAKSKETRGMIEHNSEVYNHPYILYMYNIWKKISVGVMLYFTVMFDHPSFPYFLPFWYPYILLHFKCFLLLVIQHSMMMVITWTETTLGPISSMARVMMASLATWIVRGPETSTETTSE